MVKKATMKKLSKENEIWMANVQEEDIQTAINYATISLPWTFDRMRYGSKSQRRVNDRLWHILIGVLNQSILKRLLTKRGFHCEMDWTSYRESDIFDFTIDDKVYDVKTSIIFCEYDEANHRPRFSPKLLVENCTYSGPKWRRFFPLLVATSQLTIDRAKDSYIFGLVKVSRDLRKTKPLPKDQGFWCSVPFGKAFTFFHSTILIKAREKAGRGFFPTIEWKRTQTVLQNGQEVKVTFFGEWATKPKIVWQTLAPGEQKILREEFSALSCIRIEHPASLTDSDEIVISVKNNFNDFIAKSTNPNTNLNDSNFTWEIHKASCVNLQIPKDYKVYWIGHIPFNEFATTFQKYPSYFIFDPKTGNDDNTPGRLSRRMEERLASLDKRREKAIEAGKVIPWPSFSSRIKGKIINAGILLSAMGPNGRPLGAACYYYPPYALQESALYVLPQDLYTMDSLFLKSKRRK